MECRLSWEGNKSSDSEEIPCILWNPKDSSPHLHVPTPIPFLSQISQVCERVIIYMIFDLSIIICKMCYMFSVIIIITESCKQIIMWWLILSLLYFTAYTVTESLFNFLCGKHLFVLVRCCYLCFRPYSTA